MDYPSIETHAQESQPLIHSSGEVEVHDTSCCSPDSTWWRVLHVACFATGGLTFIAGSVCYLYPDWGASYLYAAVLYIVGSCGFLGVDVEEFCTFRDPLRLRVNISLSVLGSLLYVIGSVGFLPSVTAWSAGIGPWGFILGSLFIGTSQLWKLVRIACHGNDSWATLREMFSLRNLIEDAGQWTQMGVELSACLGGWFFFFSTLMYQYGDSSDQSYFALIARLWIVGSVWFSAGSLFLAYRHFVMGAS